MFTFLAHKKKKTTLAGERCSIQSDTYLVGIYISQPVLNMAVNNQL